MSTTIKRVALVAVAALGLGVLSVAPSNATAQMDSIALSATTAAQTAGDTRTASSAYVTASFLGNSSDTMTLTLSLLSGPAGNTKLPAFALKETSTANVLISGLTAAVSGDSTTASAATAKVYVYMDGATLAGDYVVKITPSGTGINSTAVTHTITVAKKVLGWTTAFIANGTTTAGADATAATLTYSASPLTTVKASITVAQGYGSTASLDTATADAKDIVVATTKGLISKSALTYADAAKTVTTAAGTGTSTYYVYSNGDIGTASITITVGGVLVSTKTVTFYGAAASLAATPTTAAPYWAVVGGTTESTTVTAKDSAGTTVSTLPTGLTVTSSDTSVATVTISAGNVLITPLKAGNVTVTVTDPATSAAATAVSFPVHVAPVKSAAAPVISFDKSAYAVGELVTMTVSADMGDKAATLFTAALKASASVQVTSTVDPFAVGTTTHALKGGKVVYTFYAPAVSGTFTVTGTTGSDVDLTTAAVVTKTIDILNPGVDAATDAANEAAAAASDATDAALAAADAADAATAAAQDAVEAVAALSLEVNTLIKALKAQITTLTNLVIKIQKKVKA